MTPATWTTYVRLKTRTNSTTFTDADIKVFMETRQLEIAGEILKADEDILLIPQTQNLVKDQREYPFPSDILSSIKRVEAKLDGTAVLVLHEIDLSNLLKPTDETNITYNFSNLQDEAFYDIKRRALYIYSGSIIAVTSGLKVWTNTYPAVITNLASTTDMSVDPSTTTHGVPKEMHEIWARGVIIDYKQSREKPIPLTETELRYEFDKNRAVEILKHGDLSRDVIGKLPSAADRGNEGMDY